MKINILVIIIFFSIIPTLKAQTKEDEKSQHAVTASWIRQHITTNPVTASWIKKNLKKESPRLILTKATEKKLKKQIQRDPLMRTYYSYLHNYADKICTKPLLERKLIGKRLLSVSRKAVLRISTLALVYRIEKDEKYLNRLAKEINTVSHFSDWHPAHFLDVAEMSYAVAIGLDWAGKWLPKNTVDIARSALKKHLIISLQDEDYNWWINVSHNWNQVCHSGLSAAALVLADEYPQLAAKIISRAVNKLPLALASYSPDGAYPEGPTYWGYGTSYNLLAISFYKSALGTDFGLPEAPGFMQSATYRMEVVAPSGQSFNYSDAGYGNLGLYTRGSLAWFAQKTGNNLYFNKEKLLSLVHEAINNRNPPDRLAPAQLIWLSEFRKKKSDSLPVYWKGEGHNPIAIFRADKNESTGFYLGIKGGSASVNHGNMDVGSFIFELNGVRWSVDPGTQSYHELETNKNIGSALWDESQESPRWSLLTKGNQFHSTLTVNGERHNVDGFSPIKKFEVNNKPQIVSLNLNTIFKGQLDSAVRTFKKIDDHTLQIEDDITPTDSTNVVTWTMVTQAEVTTTKHGALLKQDNKELHLDIINPADINVSVISLDPPPRPYDKQIKGLKKLEINIPYYILKKDYGKIIVKLRGKPQ